MAHAGVADNRETEHEVEPQTLELRLLMGELGESRLDWVPLPWCAMRFGELPERTVATSTCGQPGEDPQGSGPLRGRVHRRATQERRRNRDVAIPPHLVPLVKDHLKNLTAPSREALLFPAATDDNLHVAPSTLYKVYHPARKAAGREDLG